MRYLIYIFPTLVNMMFGGMFFITSYRFSEAGAPKLKIVATMIAWATVYSIFSMLCGRIVNAKRAARMIMLGCLFMFISAVGAIRLPGLDLQYLWLCLVAFGGAFYATAFQVYMKSLEEGASGGTVRSVAFYTTAWSLGIAIGPFIFGLIPWRIAYLCNAAGAVLIALGTLFISRHVEKKGASASAAPVPEQEPLYQGRPNLVWVGWTAGLGASMYVSILRSLEPDLAVHFHIGQFHGAMVLALVSFTQAIFALFLSRSRLWMYSRLPVVFFMLFGVAGIWLMTFGDRSLPLMYASAVLCGIYTTPAYFLFVFHSLIHPTKNGIYVSINEALVGVSGIVTPFLGGLIASHASTAAAFQAMGICLVLLTGVQLLLYRKA